jgi:outer membrane receptor protein involved in Fe transport
MSMLPRELLSISIAAAACLSAQAHAQRALDEIVVTAQKREQSLMDVPISVSAVTGEKIKDSNIQRFEDMSIYVPNFKVTQDPIGDKIGIRGLQSSNQAGFEQSVGTFVDGIYRGRGVQSRFAFLDVGMIEVLRGPQPTLFGKNTIAGALNIRTARPTSELESELSAQYNPEFEEAEYQGFVSGPLSDTLRGRAVVLQRGMDKGWVENSAYDEDNPDADELFGRIALEWDASDSTLVSLRAETGDWDVTGQPWVILEGGALSPLLAAAGVPEGKGYETSMGNNGFPLLGIPGDPVIDFGSVAGFEGDADEVALTVEHELAGGSQLVAILGYSQYDYERPLDADFNPLPVVRFDDTEDFEQTSFELRLASETGRTIDYIAGLYYQDSTLYADGLTMFNLSAIDQVLGLGCAVGGGSGAVVPGNPVGTAIAVAGTVPGSSASLANACAQTALAGSLVDAGVSGVNRYAYLDQESESWAVFAQPTWNVTDTVRLTLGLRYTEEDKDAGQGVYAADYGAGSQPVDPASLEAFAAYLVGEFTPHAFTEDDPGMSRSEESFTWSFNAQWDVTSDVMAYASAATGFKAGGFNSYYMGRAQNGGADSNEAAFEEEEVTAYEIGAKTALLDGAAELNIAAFRTEYTDLQVSLFSGNTTFNVGNAAEATVQGLEVDARWQATDKLNLQAALGYLDFGFDEFDNAGCTSDQFVAERERQYQEAIAAGDLFSAALTSLLYSSGGCAADGLNDLGGSTNANAPDWTGSLIATYVQPIGSYELTATVDISYTDDVYRAEDLDPISLQESWTNVNALLMFAPDDGHWDLSLVGKNLTDEETYSFVADMPLFNGSHEARMDAPRSVAVRGRYRF